jgi:hypothetical protein
MRIQYFQGTKTAKEIAAHPLFASYNLTEAEVAAILASPGVSAPAAAPAAAPAPVTSPSSFDKLKLLSPSAAAAALEKPPVKEAKVELKLNMQLNEIQDRAKFSSEVSEDIAKAADIKKESVRVEGLRAGSVLVDLVITATEGGKDAAAVAFGLEAQARDKSSALFKGKHTSKTDGLGLKLVRAARPGLVSWVVGPRAVAALCRLGWASRWVRVDWPPLCVLKEAPS